MRCGVGWVLALVILHLQAGTGRGGTASSARVVANTRLAEGQLDIGHVAFGWGMCSTCPLGIFHRSRHRAPGDNMGQRTLVRSAKGFVALALRGGADLPAHDGDTETAEYNVSWFVHGPYDAQPEPNPLGDSSTTLSDVSEDPLFPEENQRKMRQMIKQFDAEHGAPDIDPYVGKTFPVLERVLDRSEYMHYWRPGIVNKRLWAAAETGDDEDIEFLVQFLEADVNTVDLNIYNYTALFLAAMNGHTQTVELLIRLGANINATDMHGSTALHYAADRGWPLVVETLHTAGIHTWQRNHLGRTALDWAMDFVSSYNASRTPIEDKMRLFTNRMVYTEGKGDSPGLVGSNWDSLWVLRRVMGLPPLDKLHRTGALQNYRAWVREYLVDARQHQNHPRTVFDMPPLLPDGTTFDDSILLDRLPRKFSSPFYREPQVCVCVAERERTCVCVCVCVYIYIYRLHPPRPPATQVLVAV